MNARAPSLVDTGQRQLCSIPPLDAGIVHLWLARLPSSKTVRELQACLSPEERDRAMGFRFESGRHQAVASRGILRTLLGHYTGIPPGDIDFSYNPFGKPFLRPLLGSGDRVEFNVSHSDDLILIAFSRNRRVGVDVERVRQGFPVHEITTRFYSDRDCRQIEALAGEKQIERFFVSWTRREAYLKALGSGLSVPIDQLDVLTEQHESEAAVSVADLEQKSGAWSIQSLRVVPGFEAALVVEGVDFQVREFVWREHVLRS